LWNYPTANISNRVARIVDCRRKSDIHYGRRHHNPIPPETVNISILLLCWEHGLYGIIEIGVLLMKLIAAWLKLWFELGRNAGYERSQVVLGMLLITRTSTDQDPVS
jgi:hypothetical protein